MREMFRLASLHNIKPIVEKMPLDRCNEAVDKLLEGSARYRCDQCSYFHVVFIASALWFGAVCVMLCIA